MKRKAKAVWKGGGKSGKGHLTTQSKILKKAQYSSSSRFEEGKGTNPEELIAAAHAGCFTMKLSFILNGAGYEPEKLTTSCTITLEDGSITQSLLVLKAKVSGISEKEFGPLVNDAKAQCPVSKLLNTDIALEFTLNQE